MADDDLATPAAAAPDIQGAPAPTDAGPQITPDAAPVANEPDIARSADQAAAARQTRAYRGGRPLPAQPAPIAAPTPEGDENPYTRFGTSEDDGIGLYERFRLNALNSYYRGTLAGSGRMMALAHLVRNPDADDLSPEEKKAHDDQRVQYQEIIADLARYDLIAGWSGGSEAASAFGGTVAGSLLSPESFVGAAAKGASVIARTGRAALQQAGIMAAVDPLVQYQSIAGGTEKDFSPTRWIMSAGVGAIIGGGLHFGGELVGNLALKRTFADLAGEDASFYRPGQEASSPVGPQGSAPNLSAVLSSLDRPVSIRGMEGERVPDPVARDLLASPNEIAAVERILAANGISNLRPLSGGYGTSSVVLDAGSSVVRLGRGAPRQQPAVPFILQPTMATEINGIRVEVLPKVETRGITEADVATMKAEADRLGYVWDDAGTDNLGKLPDGRLIIIDGTVTPKEGAANAGRTGEPTREPGGTSEPAPATEGAAAPTAAGATAPEGGGAAQPREAGTAEGVAEVPPQNLPASVPASGPRAAQMYAPPDPLDLVMSGKLTPIEAKNIADRLKDNQREIENSIFGGEETANEWRKLHRQSDRAWDNADDAKAHEYDRKLTELEERSNLTKEDQAYLDGHGWPEHSDPNDWQQLARNLDDISFGREDAIKIASHELRYLPNNANWDKLASSEKQSVITILSAMNEEVRHGRDPQAFLREVAQDRMRRYGGGPDAQEATEGHIEKLAALMRGGIQREGMAAPIVPQLPQPRENAALASVARRGGDGEMRLVSVPENEVRPTDRVQRPAEGEQAAIAQRQGDFRIPMEQKRPSEGIESPQVPQTSQSQTTVDINGQRTRIQDGVVSTDAAEAAGPKESAIRSLQQQATDFADAIGFPLRQGRMAGHGKEVLGIFKSKQGVVRVREVPDFEVVAHEGGHYIEAKMGQDLTDLIEQFGPTELAKMVSNPAAYDPAVHAKEGFAEYIRRYIGNPNFAANQAPGFTTAFRDFMNERAPQMLHAIDDASAAYRAYLEAPSVDAVGAVIRSQDEGAHGWRSYLPRKIRDEGFPVIIKTMMQDAYTGLFDRNAPITRAVREMAEAIRDAKGGALVDLKAADNPDTLMRLFARSQQGAVRDMMDGVRGYRDVVPQGPSLSQALAKATGSPTVFGRWNQPLVDSFSTYLIARRAIVLWDRFGRGDLPNPPTAFSKGDATVALQDLERANPSFREAGDMVHGWTRQLLKKQFDGGLIGADLYSRLTQEEFYVPFMRDLSDKPLAGGGGPGGGSGVPGERVADTVKAIKGSARDIKNPIESLMMQAFLVNRAVKHTDIIRSLANLSKQAGIEGGRYFEKIPAKEMHKYTFDLKEAITRAAREKGMNEDDTEVLTSALSDVFGEDPLVGSFFRAEPAGARGEPIVFYMDGGEVQGGRVMSGEEGHALYETLTALPSGISDVAMQLFSAGSTLLRGTITTNPVFALTNYIRDQVAVGVLRKDYIPFVSGTKGIVSEVTEGESAKLYGYAGGVSAGASVAPLEQAAKAEIDALAKQGYLVNRLSSLHGLLEFAAITEAGTRNSVFDTVYNAKRAQGLSDYEAMIEAAFQAQDVLDFSRWGSKTLAIRRLTPFVNAHMQGLEKAWRTLGEPLYRQAVFTTDPDVKRNALIGLTKFGAVGGSLGAAWAALHHNDEIYQDARPELKGTHFVTSIGNKIFVIPKPFELSLGFTAGEFAYQALMKNDPRSAAAFAEAAFEVLKPPIPIYDNPLIKTTSELYLGRSGFFGRDIVPDALQRLQPSEQYTDRTSSVAKSIGQTIGVSPIKVDYAIGAYFGLWGRDIMSLSSGVDERTPAQNWEDRALVRRFIKDPTRSSETVGQFWKFMGQTTGQFSQAVATYDFFNKSFRDQEAQDFLAKLPAPERAFTILRSAAREDGKPAFGPDEKRLFPLQRAYDAVAILNGMRRELSDNSFRAIETGTPQQFSPRERRDLIDDLRELAQMEMRNSFVVMKTKGYANRPLMDVQAIYDKVRAIAPPVAEELATRYATGRIYKTEAVASSYDKMQAELIRNGSQAELMDLSADAKAMGYEFGGERVRKPQKRRVLVPAAPVAAPPAPSAVAPPLGR